MQAIFCAVTIVTGLLTCTAPMQLRAAQRLLSGYQAADQVTGGLLNPRLVREGDWDWDVAIKAGPHFSAK